MPSKVLRSESDERLMARAQKDDIAAFEVLYDRYAGRALAVSRSVLFDRGRAEDAVQDGFLSIWRARRRYRPEAGSFKAWAMTVIRHRAVDSVRAAASRPEPAEIQEGQALETSASPADEVIADEAAAALRATLGRLPEEQSEVVALAFFGELTHSEIANQLGLPLGTVKGRMRLGLEKMRTRLEVSESSIDPENRLERSVQRGESRRRSQNGIPGAETTVRPAR